MSVVVRAAVQELPKAEHSGVLNKNTGFPEPLSPYRNTTLTHPSADTSQNACIESADVPLSRTHSRHSSFQLPRMTSHSHHKSKNSLPTNNTAGLYDGSNEHHNVTAAAAAAVENRDVEGETDHERLERERDAQGYAEGERRKGVLRKLRLHKV